MADTSFLGQSALQAFRADLPVGGAAPDAEDEAAVIVATLLRQPLTIPSDDPDRERIRGRAVEIARESLGAETLAARTNLELVSAGEARRPPFMLRTLQMSTYMSELEFIGTIHRLVRPYRRRVINAELLDPAIKAG